MQKYSTKENTLALGAINSGAKGYVNQALAERRKNNAVKQKIKVYSNARRTSAQRRQREYRKSINGKKGTGFKMCLLLARGINQAVSVTREARNKHNTKMDGP